MSLAQALELSDAGRFREACAVLEPLIASGGEDAAVASAYLVGWSVHVPEIDVGGVRLAQRAANANGRSRDLLMLEMVTRAGWRGRMGGAASRLERALPALTRALPPWRRARMHGYGAMLELARGDVACAESHARKASALAERLGDRRWRVFTEAALALCELERSELGAASDRLARLRPLARGLSDAMILTTVSLVEGELSMDRGDHEGAVEAYTRAVVASDGRHLFMAPWAWVSVSAAQAERGRLGEARFALERARATSRSLGSATQAAVALRAHHLAIAEERPGARTEAEIALRALRDEVAIRRWRRVLAASLRERSSVLEVAVDRRWFRVDDGPSISLERSPMQRRLLDCLLARRWSGRGPAVAKELLEDLGIEPVSEIEHDRAVARVHAATVRLRRAGLGELLVHHGEGLAIHPRAYVEEAP